MPPSLPASMEQATPSSLVSAPTSALSSMPSLQPFPKPKQDKDEVELHSLRHLYKEIKNKTNLPEDIKKVLNATEDQVRKVDAKTHGQLVAQLNTMRKKLNQIDEEWEAYRTQWANYLDKATQMWMSHVESYEQGEIKFAERRSEALQNLKTTRAALHDAHLKTMEQDVLGTSAIETAQAALDESMFVEEPAEFGPGLTKIKEELTGVVQQVKNTIEDRIRKRDRSQTRAQGPEAAESQEVEVIEPADKRPRDSN